MSVEENNELEKQTVEWLNALKNGSDSEKLRVIGETLVAIHLHAFNLDENVSLIRDLHRVLD